MERLIRISSYLPSNPVIIEAGANNGEDTLKMLQFWPEARIFALEPYPKVYEILKRSVSDYPKASAYCLALGDRVGLAEFYVSRHPEYFASSEEDPGCASSLLRPSPTLWQEPGTLFENTIEVPVILLDLFAANERIENVDFLWLDMQGAEGLVLQASPNILRTVKVIHTEYSDKPFYEGSIVFEDLTAFLEAKGFSLLCRNGGNCGDAVYINFHNL